MDYTRITMAPRKRIALVAHDNKKQDLFDWAKYNRVLLSEHKLFATGTTGAVLEQRLGLKIESLRAVPSVAISKSGPKSRAARSTSSSSFGTRSKLCRTTRTSNAVANRYGVEHSCSLQSFDRGLCYFLTVDVRRISATRSGLHALPIPARKRAQLQPARGSTGVDISGRPLWERYPSRGTALVCRMLAALHRGGPTPPRGWSRGLPPARSIARPAAPLRWARGTCDGHPGGDDQTRRGEYDRSSGPDAKLHRKLQVTLKQPVIHGLQHLLEDLKHADDGIFVVQGEVFQPGALAHPQ